MEKRNRGSSGVEKDYKGRSSGEVYDGGEIGVINFADAIRDEDAIIEGYKKGIEEYRGVTFRSKNKGRVKEFYLSPLSGDFGIFDKIVKIANGSFTVDAVADDKKLMIAGSPLIFKKGKNRKFSFRKLRKMEDLSDNELDIIEERLNILGDVGNIRDLGEGVIEDLMKAGNCFIQIRRSKRDDGKYDLYFSIMPVQSCRLKMRSWYDATLKNYSVDQTEAFMVGVCSDWSGANRIMSRGDIWDIPILGRGETEGDDWRQVVIGEVEYEVSCIHLKYRKTGFRHYGMPRWIPSYWYAVIENLFGRTNAAKIKNSGLPSGVLQLFANPSITKPRAAELKNEVQKNYTTMDTTGRLLVQVLTDKNLAAHFVPFGDGKKDGDWVELLKMASKALITSMKTFPDLAGIAVAGELGGTDKVKSNYIITQARDIVPNQDFIIDKVYLKIFEMIYDMEGDENFKLLNCEYSNAVPVLLFGDVNLENILDRDEIRAELGYPTQGKEYNNKPINNNPNGGIN